jgi:hypothetical protein
MWLRRLSSAGLIFSMEFIFRAAPLRAGFGREEMILSRRIRQDRAGRRSLRSSRTERFGHALCI